MTFSCAVCGGTEGREVVTLERYPVCLAPLPAEVARRVEREALTLAACSRCGHMQVPSVDPRVQRLLYEVYYSYYQVDGMETMLPAYREPFNRLLTALAAKGVLPNGRLLEIGCSSGAMIPVLSRFCSDYTGIDPSDRIETARAAHPGATFVREYFPSVNIAGPFDVIVTQFNLEHIERAGEFISEARRLARDGAVLVIQVPDAGYYLRTRQPNFLAHEHVHYFRRQQLARLLLLRGFEPVAWGDEGASLICAARATEVSDAAVEEDPLRDLEDLPSLMSSVPELPRGAVLYGVGLTLHWLLALQPSLAVDAVVVDDNEGYRGYGVPGYDLLIEAPLPRRLASRSEIVLTLNEIYHDAVLGRLRAMGVQGRIHRISEGRWTTEKA